MSSVFRIKPVNFLKGLRAFRLRYLVFLALFVTSLAMDVPVVDASTCVTSGNNVTISSDCFFSPGTFTFTGTLTINAGVTVTAQGDTSGAGSGVIINADSFDIEGTLTADSQGFAFGAGTGHGVSAGSGGGYGGAGSTNNVVGGTGGGTYGSVTQPTDLGSGADSITGPSGGSGGGAIKLVASGGTVTVGSTGIISANGGTATSNRGGGSGGSIWIDANTLSGSGTIRANGGTGGPLGGGSGFGGSGGGGRIALYYLTDSSTFARTAYGARSSTGNSSGAGTIYLRDYGTPTSKLIVDDNNLASAAATTQVTTASQTYGDLTIRNGASYVIPNGFTLSATGTITGGGSTTPALTINSGGTFVRSGGSATFVGSSFITSLTLTNNGTINFAGAAVTLSSGSLTWNPANFTGTLASLTIAGGTFSQSGTGAISMTGALTVQSGAVLTHTANSSSLVNQINISAGSIDIQSGGSVSANTRGFTSGQGTGHGNNVNGGGGSGAGYGGVGGAGCCGGAAAEYGSVKQPTDLGSGGGDNTAGGGGGGTGGGAIKLVTTGALNVSGTVSANGGTAVGGTGGGGGGSGGSIWLDGNSLTGAGTVSANGAAGVGNAGIQAGGGAGGGRIAAYASTSSQTWTMQAFGGAAGNGGGSYSPSGGGAGTIYVRDYGGSTDSLTISNNNSALGTTTQITTASQTYGSVTIKNGASYIVPNTFTLSATGTFTGGGTAVPTLTINSGGTLSLGGTISFSTINVTNNGTISGSGANVTISSGTLSGTGSYGSGINNLTIGSGGTFTQSGTSVLALTGALTVQSGGTLNHTANTTTRANVVNISAASIDVQTGGSVSANTKGFTGGNGTGKGSDQGGGGGGGAAYGGNGGAGVGVAGGTAYGSVQQPTDLGSAGGANSIGGGTGGIGGGAIKLVATGTINVSGTVSSNGASPGQGGGGAGGSIWIDGNTLTGAGTVTANGAAGVGITLQGGGGGSGGRIAIYSSVSTQTWTEQAFGAGPGATSNGQTGGGAGTIYVRDYGGSTDSLTVNNNNNAYSGTSQVSTLSQTYGTVTINNGAAYVIPNTFTLSATGSFVTGGNAKPSLAINNGGTFVAPSTMSTSGGLTITDAGTFTPGATSFTLTSTSSFTESGTGTFGSGLTDMTIRNNSSFTTVGTGTLTLTGTLTVMAGSTMTHTANTTSGAGKVNNLTLNVGTLDVQAGARIAADGKGFASTEGTGQGTDATNAGGGGYGGAGGAGVASGGAGGSSYGSSSNPVDLGSGGGVSGASAGGAGGGEIRITASTMTINGTISASGTAGTGAQAGAGSGGTIRLIVNGTLSGSGLIIAQGGVGAGNNTTGGGCGSGGRIAIDVNTDSYAGTRTANADTSCTGSRLGSNGTVAINQNYSSTLTAPNGGQSLVGGQPFNITWTEIGPADHYRITLSTDGGSSYPTTVVTSTPSSPYSWTVTNVTTATARIKVEQMDASNVVLSSDTSDANFSITATNISLTAPNGGQDLLSGQHFNVTWTSSGTIDHFRIKLSTDSGSTFPTTVASGVTSPYDWTVPALTTTTARIKVEALDASNNVLNSDASDADFSIAIVTLTVTAPNGGESLAGNAPYNITWSSAGTIDHLRITLSTNGGTSYGTTVTSSTPSSPYAWTVPNITTSTARIKVEALDGSNVVLASDTSNANFSITASALTVTAPNGGERLSGGGLYSVTWSGSGLIDHYRIKLSSDGGSTFPTTVTSSATGSSYAWTVTAIDTSQGILQIEGLDASNNVLATDVSNAVFTIDTLFVSTTANRITFSRLKVGTLSNWTLTFGLYHTLASDLSVTFPSGFTSVTVPTIGSSSACLSNFTVINDSPSAGMTTITADKNNCSGTIVLGGGTAVLPNTPGTYVISWVNDDPGSGSMITTDEDQISISAAVDPVITFNVGVQAAATDCDGAYAGNGGLLALGAITTSAVTTSDASSIAHICSRLSTNSTAGATISVRNANGASGLVSTSVPASTIPSSSATLTAGTPGYGLCGGSGVADSGKDTTVPVGSTPTAVSPFNGSCTTSAQAVGGFLTTAQTVWNVASSVQNAFFRLYLKASASPTTAAHTDYTDTLTFVATGTF